jgi:rare lipoprotein A (peptidoglycan hydrolase)
MIARVSTSLACALLALAPVAARAQTPAAGGVAAPEMVPPAQAVSASSGGLTVTAMPDQTLGEIARFSGKAPANRLVRLQRQDSTTQKWKNVARARADATGAFTARWRPNHIGPTALRAILHTTAAPLRIMVYKPTVATWYGPGFFGNQTACGQVLSPDLQGVAHRSLPCGTQVAFTYNGRTNVVPLIDRGPYGVAGADWDLTQATAAALGITATAPLGAVRLRDDQAPASR